MANIQISNRKRKQILRLADQKGTSELARIVNLPFEVVEQVIAEARGTTGTAPDVTQKLPFLRRYPPFLLCFCACLALSPLLMAPRKLHDMAGLPQAVFIEIAAVALMAGWLINAGNRQENRLLLTSLHLPLGLFLTWALLSGLWSRNHYEFWLTAGHWLACGLMFLVLVHNLRRGEDVILVLRTLYGTGFVVALIGIGQFLFRWDYIPQVAPPAATFANKNFAVHLIVPVLAIGIGLYLRARKPLLICLYGVTGALIVAYLFYTGTRAGWAAFFLELIAWLVILAFSRKALAAGWTRLKTVTTLAAVVLALVMIHFTPDGFRWTIAEQLHRLTHDASQISEIDARPNSPSSADDPDQTSPDGAGKVAPIPLRREGAVTMEASFAGRLKVWRNTLYLIADHWLLGTGAGNFKLYFPLYDGRSDGIPMFDERIQLSNSHNDYVQIWAELGTVGLLLLAAIIVVGAWTWWRLWRQAEADRLVTAGVGIALLGMLLNALPSMPLQKAIPPLVIMVLAAVLAWLDRGRRPGREVTVPPGLMLTLGIIAAVGCFLLTELEVRRIKADHHFWFMSGASKQKRWDYVYVHGHRAIDVLPGRSKARAYLGKAAIELGDQAAAAGNGQKAETYFEEALRHLRVVEHDYPNSPNSLFDQGVAYAKLNQGDKALEYYARVGRLMPGYPRLHNNIAAVYMTQGRVDEALAEFKIETEHNPDQQRVWFNYGVALMQAGKYEQSEPILRKAAKLDPDHDLTQKNLGVLLYQFLGRREEGLKHLERALELNPNVAEADKIRKLLGKRPPDKR